MPNPETTSQQSTSNQKDDQNPANSWNESDTLSRRSFCRLTAVIGMALVTGCTPGKTDVIVHSPTATILPTSTPEPTRTPEPTKVPPTPVVLEVYSLQDLETLSPDEKVNASRKALKEQVNQAIAKRPDWAGKTYASFKNGFEVYRLTQPDGSQKELILGLMEEAVQVIMVGRTPVNQLLSIKDKQAVIPHARPDGIIAWRTLVEGVGSQSFTFYDLDGIAYQSSLKTIGGNNKPAVVVETSGRMVPMYDKNDGKLIQPIEGMVAVENPDKANPQKTQLLQWGEKGWQPMALPEDMPIDKIVKEKDESITGYNLVGRRIGLWKPETKLWARNSIWDQEYMNKIFLQNLKSQGINPEEIQNLFKDNRNRLNYKTAVVEKTNRELYYQYLPFFGLIGGVVETFNPNTNHNVVSLIVLTKLNGIFKDSPTFLPIEIARFDNLTKKSIIRRSQNILNRPNGSTLPTREMNKLLPWNYSDYMRSINSLVFKFWSGDILLGKNPQPTQTVKEWKSTNYSAPDLPDQTIPDAPQIISPASWDKHLIIMKNDQPYLEGFAPLSSVMNTFDSANL